MVVALTHRELTIRTLIVGENLPNPSMSTTYESVTQVPITLLKAEVFPQPLTIRKNLHKAKLLSFRQSYCTFFRNPVFAVSKSPNERPLFPHWESFFKLYSKVSLREKTVYYYEKSRDENCKTS